MQNEALTNARYPDNGDAADVALYIEQAVKDLADGTIPNFASTAARDSAYSAWVAQGNSMRNGLHCWVGSKRYVYLSGAWVEDPVGYQNRMMRAWRNSDTGFNPTIGNTTWEAFTSSTNWEEVDPHGMRSTGATFVAQWTGWYTLGASIGFAADSAGDRGLRINPVGFDMGRGSGIPFYIGQCRASAGFGTYFTGTAPPCLINAGQTAQLEGRQSSAAGLVVEHVSLWATYHGPNL